MQVSQTGGIRERSNDTLGELLQATTYAKVDFTGQENAEKVDLWVGNVRTKHVRQNQSSACVKCSIA